ncbi:MAG: carboxypeptidase regulatory-like domain-containing protein, partial [Chloroflexi bacterium]|nr:carboxypeptidase regulatory-like domain-containing protein [Chloroflexota bacterium]
FPSIYYTGRLAGDPLNSMSLGEGVLFTGTGAQTHSASRWGDYSMMAVDPNGCTFWYTNEYLETTGSAPWLTRIGSFNLPGCNSGTLSGTVTDASTTLPISGATVTVAGLSAQTNGSGFYTVATVPAGSYTVTAAKTGYHTGTANNVGITDGNTTTRDFALTPAGCTDKCLRVVSITMGLARWHEKHEQAHQLDWCGCVQRERRKRRLHDHRHRYH